MKRARSAEQKDLRRHEILAAAAQLYATRRLEAISMQDIARAAGLAKGSLYLYFETKEELYLTLLESSLQQWLAQLDAWLLAQTSPLHAAALATELARSLQRHPMLVRMLAILHTVLEHNLDRVRIAQFKHFLLRTLSHTASLIEQKLPRLLPGQGLQLLLRIDALVIGLQHLSDPAPAVRQVLEAQAALAGFRVDFARELEPCILALILHLTQA